MLCKSSIYEESIEADLAMYDQMVALAEAEHGSDHPEVDKALSDRHSFVSASAVVNQGNPILNNEAGFRLAEAGDEKGALAYFVMATKGAPTVAEYPNNAGVMFLRLSTILLFCSPFWVPGIFMLPLWLLL